MKTHLEKACELGQTADNVEAKSVSGLSTIMVATIQEAKDRISQIEYIFCGQLFPTFQSKCNTLQKIYSKAREDAEDAWKETEKDHLRQIEELKLEKQQVFAENQAIKLEKIKQAEESGGNIDLLLKSRGQKEKIKELKHELQQKCKEVDEGMELHSKLVQLVQAKSSEVVNKDEQLKEHEEEINMLHSQAKTLGKKVDILQEELKQKAEIITQKTEVAKNLLKKVETLSLEAANSEQILNDSEQEKKRLMTRLEIYEENVGRLEEMLRQKTDELEDRRKVLDLLHQKLDLGEREILNYKQQLLDHEKENKLLVEKVQCLGDEINCLQFKLKTQNSYEDLRQEIELKSFEAATEKKKRKDAYEAYKRLKSQYTFLCRRFGLTTENILPRNKVEGETDPLRHRGSPAASSVLENRKSVTPEAASAAKKTRSDSGITDDQEKEKIITTVQTSASSSPTINLPIPQKCPSSSNSVPIAGTKRPASTWRDTRSRQSPGGTDPHDDFLDTPLENVRKELNKAIDKQEQHLAPDPNKVESDDDETQDVNPDPGLQKQRIDVIGSSKRTFKYVEPVRKKAERDNLRGIECKQCKKFYDAVLPENGGKDGDGNRNRLRCEHHEGVSRHRYKYAPPMTPEGFWNIGFESEM